LDENYPLCEAIVGGNIEVIQYLLDHGADFLKDTDYLFWFLRE